MIDDRLLGLKRPARYIGSEWNVAAKPFEDAAFRCALCFPDLYDVGMSNLGVRIIYSLINGMDGACCERVFMPDTDMEKFLRENKEPLFSLESQQPVSRFDLLAFNIGYELSYTNVLAILELSGIPLRSADRSDRDPIVLAAGTSVFNPEPMHEFIDVFFIGEGEEAVEEIVRVFREYRGKLSRKDFLARLAAIDGIYVPSLYAVEYEENGGVRAFTPLHPAAPAQVRKRFVRDLETAYFPVNWLVPYIQVVHDRVTVEIMRGCPNHCRFCQARVQYHPLRMRTPETVLKLAEGLCRNTGYEELSLSGLSTSDYPRLKEILGPLVKQFKRDGIGVSLPSIKPKVMLGELSTIIASIRKTGLTFAPEAGSERMRRVMGKDFSEEELFQTLEQAYQAGYQHVKLYFMIGLPSETEKDLDMIIDLAVRVSELRRKLKGRPAQVNISVNTLIPKPHTPFQWNAVLDMQEIQKRQAYIRAKCRNRNLRFSFHNRAMSFLEAVFSRGDRKLSGAILDAYAKGARFDGWEEHFNLERWMDAFAACGIDPRRYLAQRPSEARLPWDFIDTGISRETLAREYAASEEEAARE